MEITINKDTQGKIELTKTDILRLLYKQKILTKTELEKMPKDSSETCIHLTDDGVVVINWRVSNKQLTIDHLFLTRGEQKEMEEIHNEKV